MKVPHEAIKKYNGLLNEIGERYKILNLESASLADPKRLKLASDGYKICTAMEKWIEQYTRKKAVEFAHYIINGFECSHATKENIKDLYDQFNKPIK